ncbi:MAG: iron-containing alcohol dehydrogenase [[Clostridium] innocuum]|nr:iron-containing alcohol dehydrogenase [[Clostridium] innocuum]
MKNFIYSIPTEIYFGKGQIANIGRIVSGYGRKALLVYGGGSIKRNGIYDDVVKIFKENGIAWCELSGVEPNPRITTVREGVKLCREEGVEVVVPIGGGSTIDCAKVIAGAVSYDGDAWDIVLNPAKVVSVLPIVTVLTLSATGSEMDTFAVISNLETNDKIGTGHEDMRPKASVLDPSYTCSVSAYQTAAGTADIMSHIFECYFSNVQGYMQDRMAEGLLKTCIEFGVRAVQNPEDYEARANLMWTSSWAINNFIKLGKTVEWTVHPMEHQLSAYYDITHGVGLAILTPHWMEYVLNEETVEKFKDYGVNVWGIDREKDPFEIAHEAIKKTKDYFVAMGIPTTMREVGIKDETNFDVMAEKAAADLKGAYVELTKEDVKNIYRAAL